MTEQRDWLNSIGKDEVCGNCGTETHRNYCPECGQKKLRHRLQFRQLMSELFSKLFNHERGVFFTFWQMLVQPGTVIRDYVSGRQRRYVNPLTYYFLGAAVQLLSLWINLNYIRQSTIDSFNTSIASQPPQVTETLQERLGANVGEAFADSYLSAIQQGYTYVALFCFCLPWAVTLYFGNRIWKVNYRLAETVVFSLYTFGQILILTAITGVIAIRWNLTLHGILALGIYLIFPLWAHHRFFPATWSSRATTLIATLISSGLFLAAIVSLFISSMIIRIAFA